MNILRTSDYRIQYLIEPLLLFAVFFLWNRRLKKEIIGRKRAEEGLVKNQERFKIAGRASYDLIYEWDVATDSLEWFGDIDGMLGYESGEISQDTEVWLSLIHPDDLPLLEEAVNTHRTSTQPIRYGYRVQEKGGRYRYRG